MTDAPPQDQPKNQLDFVRTWLDAISLAEDEEKEWMETAERACEAYRGGKEAGSTLNTFNIFHSNIETLVPTLYNSTPIPDVRRRYNDDDPVGKEVCEIFERALSYSIDAYDFDATILSSVKDMAITSRGVARVRYEPSFDGDGKVAYEQVRCEFVPWKAFRRGPGRVWDDVPWIAFENYLSHSEVEKLLDGEPGAASILEEMKFTYTAEPKKSPEQQGENLSKLAARARVWEIWDKDSRKVHFICPDYTSRVLTSVDDPLEAAEFFPIPRPLAAIMAPDSLVPVTLLQVYEKLLEELNEVQRRIVKLVKQLRPRFAYAGISSEIKQLNEADDGEGVPLESAEMLVTNGKGIEGAITWWPLEATAAALKQLVEQREFIKQTIYEVTGLSDIIRGASDSRETATAQQIKSQWGSIRIQRMQQEVARFVRDLFRLKCEVMTKKFSFQTFVQMTGLRYPSQQEKQQAQQLLAIGQQAMQQGAQIPPELQQQAKQLQEVVAKPAAEEIEQLLRNDATRGFRVDVESDSTIRGDLQKNQEQMSLFLQGTAQYLSAVGPLVQAGAMPQDIAVEIYAAFCRSFRLGKQAEDALDKLADAAKKGAGQQKPSPEEIKAQAEQQKLAMEMQFKEKEHQMKLQEMQMGLEIKREELALKERELELKAQEMNLKMQMGQQEMAMEAQQSQQRAAMEERSMMLESERNEREHQQGMEAAQYKHDSGMEIMAAKAKQAKQRPEARAR